MPRYFEYGEEAIAHLKGRDAKLASAIDAVGHVYREVDDDLFSAMVHHIVGQQISTAAQRTIWERMQRGFGAVTPEAIACASEDELQAFGITFKKAGYIKGFAERVRTGELDLDAVAAMDDAQAIEALRALPGIGTWTAEMLLLFCLQRPDVLSFDDLAIHRGMRMVYRHRKVTRAMFERYRRRYSPYGSVASLYLWAISHMDVPGYDRDPAPKKKPPRKG